MLEGDVDEKYYLDGKYEQLIKVNENYSEMAGGNIGKMHDISRRAYSVGYISPTLPTCAGGNIQPKVIEPFIVASRGRNPESNTCRGRVGHGVSKTLPTSDSQGVLDGVRIRKLTPKECWRLMGFDDSDFDKASKVNSNTQLYKQAGNSIVVDVLEAILVNLIQEDK